MTDIASKTMAGRRVVAMWICALDAGHGGEAQLWYPSSLTAVSANDLIEWLEFVVGVLKKRRESAPSPDAVDPVDTSSVEPSTRESQSSAPALAALLDPAPPETNEEEELTRVDRK